MIPEVLENKIKASCGALFSDVLAGYRSARSVTLRANALKSSADEVAAKLRAAGIAFSRVAWYADAFILPDAREEEVEALPLYRNGEVYLQSLSSMLPPLALAPAAGENILDMTAAPGGKTTQILALSGGKALVTACERDAVRFKRMKFNLARQGAERVNALRTDALALDDFLKFDKILLDAPCTGTGTISADSRVRFSEEYLAKCVKMQRKLLEKALRLLKKGGTLVYSTCSVLREENDGAAEEAIRRGAKLVPPEIPEEIPRLPSMEGTVCVCPNEYYEGFYVAKFTI